MLSDEEVADLVRDKKRLLRYIKQPRDIEHASAMVISSLNQAVVTVRALDELFFEDGFDPDKEVRFVSSGAFRGLLPQSGEREVLEPGGHERALGALRAGLRADLERLESLKREGERRGVEAAEEFAYKLRRSLEEEISTMLADQEGENTGCHLPQRPSWIPGMPFISQCGYTAAIAAQYVKEAVIALLAEPLKLAGYEI